MWSTEHTAETTASPAAVWAALRDLHTGAAPSGDGDTFAIHGPFAVGTELSVTPAGQETFRSRIVELVEQERYADETVFGDLTLTFRHLLVPVGAGTRVTHQLVIDGTGADAAGPELGAQISADFPAALQSLFATALQHA
jgi:Polyketide cyclase / dehydrase and lipid transport